MPITGSNILASTVYKGGVTNTIPDADSLDISLVAPSGGIPQSSVGKYLYVPASGRTLRKITAVGTEDAEGNVTVTVEFPFNVSEFRSYKRLDGTDFTATLPPAASAWSISMDMADLVAIVEEVETATGVSLINATSRAYSITEEGYTPGDSAFPDGTFGISLNEGMAIAQDDGIITGGVLRNLLINRDNHPSAIVRMGRLHAGDYTDPDGDYYTSGGIALIDEQVDGTPLTQENIGMNTQLIGGYVYLVNSTVHDEGNRFFARMYSSTDTDAEILQTNMLIDFEFRGQIGVRISGDNTFIKDFTYQEGAWRGLNFRIASANRTLGQISGLRAQDSTNLFYQNWEDSGSSTTVDGFTIVNPDHFGDGNEFILVRRFGSAGSKELILKNFDIVDWKANEDLDTDDIFFSAGVNSNNRIIAARDATVSPVDSENDALDSDNSSKLFVYTKSSTTNVGFPDRTYTDSITDGSSAFDTQTVFIRDWEARNDIRFDDTVPASGDEDVEYVNNSGDPAQFSVRSRRYTTSLFTSNFYRGDTGLDFTAIMFDDPYHSSETFTDIDAYDKLDTSQKLYDYSKRVMLENPDEIIDTGVFDYFESLDSNDILVPGLDCDVVLTTDAVLNDNDPNNLLSFSKSDLEMTIRTDTVATGGSFTGGFDLGDSNDLTIHDTIRGYVRCNNILLGTGNLFTTPDKELIDTFHSVIGNVALPGGQSYVIDGGAYIDNLNITREDGTTGAVTIKLVNYNRAAGHPTPNANVIYEDETIIKYQLEETYVPADLRYRAYEYDGDTIQNSGTEITATITSNADDNTVTLAFDTASGNNVRIATWYLGYKTHYLNAEQGAQDVELEKYSLAQLDTEAITNADDANDDTAIADYYNDATWTYVFGSGKMTITAPDTAITIPPAASKDLMHRLIAGLAGNNSFEVLKRIAQGDLNADVIEFDVESVVVDAGSITDDVHDTIAFNHIASPTDTVWNVQVLDTDGNDQSNAISTNISGNKVRFAPKAVNVFVDTAVADRFANDVAGDLDAREVTRRNMARLGLGIPVVDADGNIDTDITT